jgi:hypothetical protein
MERRRTEIWVPVLGQRFRHSRLRHVGTVYCNHKQLVYVRQGKMGLEPCTRKCGKRKLPKVFFTFYQGYL